MGDTCAKRHPGKKAYQWDPDHYSRHSGQQEAWALELLAKLCLSGREAFLDIGCGEGKITAAIAGRLPAGRVVGIDSSADMINYAKKRYPDSTHSNLKFYNIDVRKLGFREEFDLAFSNAALHWVKDHRQFLPLVRDALKPKGRLLFQMGGRGNAWEVMEIMDLLMQDEPWRPFFAGFEFPYGFYGPDEYGPWLREAGLEPAKLELITKDMRHKGAEGLAGWIRSTWLPYIERVEPALQNRFIAQLVDRYIQKHGIDAQGMVHVEMIRLEVEAFRAD